MPRPGPAPEVPTEVERSAHTASPELLCAFCRRPRSPRKREACSARCRTALSRRRRQEARQERDQEIRATLEVIVRLAQVVLSKLGTDPPRQRLPHGRRDEQGRRRDAKQGPDWLETS